MMGTDITANLSALSKQWQSFMEAVGGPLAKAAIPALQAATDVVNKMAAFADKHQTLTTMVADIALAGSGILALSGGITALKAALALKSAINNTGGASVAALGLDWSKGQAVPGALPGMGSRLLGFAGGVIPPVIAYETGKQMITSGLDALPHPTYPAGYDPQAIRNGGIAGDLSRLKGDVQPLIDAAEKAMREGFGGLAGRTGADIKAGITAIGGQFTSAIAGLPGQVAGSIATAIGSIGNTIKGLFSSIGSGLPDKHNAAPTPPGLVGGRYHPSSFIGPGASGGGPRSAQTVQVHTAIYLDRQQQRQLASVVSEHMRSPAGRLNAMGHPTRIGALGGGDTYLHPGYPMPDVA